MTAEEKARKYLENKYYELDCTANYDSAGGSELYINEIDVSKLMTDYLNSQRDTIFKEELGKKIHQTSLKKISQKEFYDPYLAYEAMKWLIQYLKK